MIKKKIYMISLILISYFIISFLSSNNLIVRANNENESILQDDEIIENNFIYSINSKKYVCEYITNEKVKELKEKMVFRNPNKEYNVIIDGHGTGLSEPTEEDLEQLLGKVSIKKLYQEESHRALASVDLSAEMYFPTVGNQGGQGSCAGWAATYYTYGYLEAKDKGWDASSGDLKYRLSVAWTYNKIVTSDTGSWMMQHFEIIEEFGCATLETMPYDDNDLTRWGSEDAWKEAPFHRALKSYSIQFNDNNPDETVNTVKDLISGGSPVVFHLDAGEYSSGFSDNNYILSADEYSSSGTNHANTFVGYDDTVEDDGETGAFKVVNSWGKGFGDDGYYWLTYKAFKEMGRSNDGLALSTVEDRVDYQPKLVATLRFDDAPRRGDDTITLGVGPSNSPLDKFTPDYKTDNNYDFPEFMAFDISDFHPHYVDDNEVNTYVKIDSSSGTISSFKIERYESGSIVETTDESPDVPCSLPGFVNNHLQKQLPPVPSIPEVILSSPIIPIILILGIIALSTIGGIIAVKKHGSNSKSPVQSKYPAKGSLSRSPRSKSSYYGNKAPIKQVVQQSRASTNLNHYNRAYRYQKPRAQQSRVQQLKVQNSHIQQLGVQKPRVQIIRPQKAGAQQLKIQKPRTQQTRVQKSYNAQPQPSQIVSRKNLGYKNKRKCPKCGAKGFNIKEMDDRIKVLSYIPKPMYARKYICKKCTLKF